jgi:hypothetical protein
LAFFLFAYDAHFADNFILKAYDLRAQEKIPKPGKAGAATESRCCP